MVATSGAVLLKPSAIRILRERLLPLAALVTPNLDETVLDLQNTNYFSLENVVGGDANTDFGQSQRLMVKSLFDMLHRQVSNAGDSSKATPPKLRSAGDCYPLTSA